MKKIVISQQELDDNIDNIFNEIAGKTIKKHREKANLSLNDVVNKMKNPISRQMLYKYENNLARMKNNFFIDICYSIGLEPDLIFKEINEKVMETTKTMANDSKNNIEIFDDTTSEYELVDENNEQQKELALLYDKVKDLPEESQKMIINVTKSIMKDIDDQLDNK